MLLLLLIVSAVTKYPLKLPAHIFSQGPWGHIRYVTILEHQVGVYLSLSGMAPAYLAADCQLVSDEGRRQLRSATSRMCVVRRTYSNYGHRCFVAAGPKLWNSLPADLQQADLAFLFLFVAEIAAHCD